MARPNWQYQILRSLAKVDADHSHLEYTRRLIDRAPPEIDWGHLLKVAYSNKVLNLVVSQLAILNQRGEVSLPDDILDPLWELRGPGTYTWPLYRRLPDFHPPIARLARVLAKKQHVLDRFLSEGVLSDLSENNVPVLFIKGVPMRLLYPKGLMRDSVDIDVAVPSLEDAWMAIRHLSGRGISFRRMRLQEMSPGTLSGEADGLSGTDVVIDLHLGAFNIVCRSAYDAPFWERAVEHPLTPDTSCLVPSLEDSLLIMVGHIRRHGQMRLRDINDAYILLHHEPRSLDWDYITRIARRNNLSPVLQCVIGHTRAAYGDLPVPPERCYSQGKIRYYTARLMQHAGDGERYRSLPYIMWHVLRYEGERYGISLALRDSAGFAMVTLERDSRVWELEARNHPIAKHLVSIFRSLLLRAILSNSWTISNVRSWFPIDIHPVDALMDGHKYEVTSIDTAKCADVATTLEVSMRRINDIVTLQSSNQDEPELVITPVGVYCAFMYKGGASREITTGAPIAHVPSLERKVGVLLKTLISRGVALTLRQVA